MDGEPLCPDPALWRLSLVTLGRATVVLHLEPRRGAACCPDCGTESRKVHSRYRRTPWDVPWAKWPVQLVIHARRFFCDNPGCPRVTFSEPFPGVLDAYARRTQRAQVSLLELAHGSNAETAARLSRLLGDVVSADTLIRRRRQETFTSPTPSALGVDEFALRRGCTYATILVDLERHRPVDVLEERTSGPLTSWLSARQGVEVLALEYVSQRGAREPARRQRHPRRHIDADPEAHRLLVREVRGGSPGGCGQRCVKGRVNARLELYRVVAGERA